MEQNLVYAIKKLGAGKIPITDIAGQFALIPNVRGKMLEMDIKPSLFMNLLSVALWDIAFKIDEIDTMSDEDLILSILESFDEQTQQYASSKSAPDTVKNWYLSFLEGKKNDINKKIEKYKLKYKPTPALPFIEGVQNVQKLNYKRKPRNSGEYIQLRTIREDGERQIAICPHCEKEGFKSVHKHKEDGEILYREGVYHYNKETQKSVFHTINEIPQEQFVEKIKEYGMRQSRVDGKVDIEKDTDNTKIGEKVTCKKCNEEGKIGTKIHRDFKSGIYKVYKGVQHHHNFHKIDTIEYRKITEEERKEHEQKVP